MQKSLLTCLLPFLLITSSHANEAPPPPHHPPYGEIMVTGTAETTLPADIGLISGEVQTAGKTASEASEKNAKIMESLRAAFLKKGFKNSDIVTTNYALYPTTRYDKVQEISIPDGFQVLHTIKIKVVKADDIGIAADLAISNGLSQIQSISFTSQNQAEAYKKLLIEALKDAKEKAVLLANAEDGKNLHITGIYANENPANPPVPMPMAMRSDMAEAAAPKTVIQHEGNILNVSIQTKWAFDK